jgi:hypothetical protein
MNLQALKEAAERLTARHQSLNDLSPGHWERMRRVYGIEKHDGYTDKVHARISMDEYTLSQWALLLLSDAPVTPEWLRDVWGADVEDRSEEWVAVFKQAWEDRAALYVYEDGTILAQNMGHTARVKGRGALQQGQFTMLALGLGLKPKEGT